MAVVVVDRGVMGRVVCIVVVVVHVMVVVVVVAHVHVVVTKHRVVEIRNLVRVSVVVHCSGVRGRREDWGDGPVMKCNGVRAATSLHVSVANGDLWRLVQKGRSRPTS